jgi:hypothetical protein
VQGLIYPKDIQANVEFRAKIFQGAESDGDLAAVVRGLAFQDVLFFCNVFCWTYDPRTDAKHVPFVTYGFQDEVIPEINRCIEAGEDLFSDKSRDMGMTYMVLYVILWRFLSKAGEQYRVGSRKEDYVDKSGDMDTLFEKLRYQLGKLPIWMMPFGWNVRKNSTYMRLTNPENGSAVIGEATNRDFARGGRQKAVFFDEYQAWEMAEEAWKSASDATKCKIVVGTPEGAANKFAELKRTDDVKNKLSLHWSLHPKKIGVSETHLEKVKRGEIFDKVGNYVVEYSGGGKISGCYVDQYGKVRSEWYDAECGRRGADDIAANLDIDYVTTGRPIFDTRICLSRQRDAVRPEWGNLVWKIRPVFNENGRCVNYEQLEVDFISTPNGVTGIWEKPKDDLVNGYVIGADTAEGLEQGDYDHACCFRRGEKPKKVAVLHGKLKMHEYAEELAKLGVYYGRCCINVERNNHGHGVILELVRIYRHLWHQDIFTKGYAEATDRIGWSTTSLSKPTIIGMMGKAISFDEFEDRDYDFWKETLTFVEDNGKMEAQGKSKGQKCYDDRIMATAIALWTHMNMPLPHKKDRKRKKREYPVVDLSSDNSLVRFVVNA